MAVFSNPGNFMNFMQKAIPIPFLAIVILGGCSEPNTPTTKPILKNKAAGKKIWITRKDRSLRTRPAKKAKRIKRLPTGSKLRVIKTLASKKKRRKGYWTKVDWNGKKGWLFDDIKEPVLREPSPDNICDGIGNRHRCILKIEKYNQELYRDYYSVVYQKRKSKKTKAKEDRPTRVGVEVTLNNGDTMLFEDSNIPSVDSSDVENYSFLMPIEGIPYVLLDVQFYEGSAWELVNTNTGESMRAYHIPVVNPSKTLFAFSSMCIEWCRQMIGLYSIGKEQPEEIYEKEFDEIDYGFSEVRFLSKYTIRLSKFKYNYDIEDFFEYPVSFRYLVKKDKKWKLVR